MPLDMNMYRSLIAGGVPPQIALMVSGGSGTPQQMPSVPPIQDNSGMPDPQGGQIEGPPMPHMPQQKPQSKLQALLPLLISAGIGGIAGGKTGAFAGVGGYGQGEREREHLGLQKEAVRGTQMNQVLARIQEQQRLANEQRRLEQADLKEVFGEVDKIAKNVDLSKPGAVEGVKQLAHSRATAQSMSMDAHKEIDAYVDALGKSYQPEEKYLVKPSGVPIASKELDIPGAIDVTPGGPPGMSFEQADKTGQRMQAAQRLAEPPKEKTPSFQEQTYEDWLKTHPGGDRVQFEADMKKQGEKPNEAGWSIQQLYDQQGKPYKTVRVNARTGEIQPIELGGALRPPRNPMADKNYANAQSGLRALETIKKELKINDEKGTIGNRNPMYAASVPAISGRIGGGTFKTARKEAEDVLTRLRTGAALNEQEQAFYASQLPSPLDDDRTILYKIKLFEDMFKSVAGQNAPEGTTQKSAVSDYIQKKQKQLGAQP